MRAISILIVFCVFTSFASAQLKSKGFNFDKFISSIEKAYLSVDDYKCKLSKKESVSNETFEDNDITYKHKKPDRYYMKWNSGDREGMEALYAGTKYDNEVLAHKGGMFSFVTVGLDPRGSTAMKGNRHPITESDLGFIISTITKEYKKAKYDSVACFYFGGESYLFGRKVIYISASFPADKGYYAHFIELYTDKILMLPLKIDIFGWNYELLESYSFKDLTINCGLTETDFDKNNPDYGF